MRYEFAGTFVRHRVVVDVASGTGMGTQVMRSLGAKTCIGLEHDRSSLRYAASTYPDCRFICCDALRLCLARDVVDVLVSLETIEHLADPASFVTECKRVLQPGGLIICSTPNRAVYRWGGSNRFHVSEMTVNEFVGLFEGQFTDVQLYGQCDVTYPAYVLKGILRSFLEQLHILKRIQPTRTFTETMAEAGTPRPEYAVEPYVARPLVKPTYLVVVARKPLR
jgi:ubiquinone/menaquinone biosynthesis C-methylase UbiE